MLDNDIQRATDHLTANLPWTLDLDIHRRLVLINMCFNLGIRRLLMFDMTLNAIKEKRWQDASNAMLNSLWAKQVGTRAKELARIILTGEWPE